MKEMKGINKEWNTQTLQNSIICAIESVVMVGFILMLHGFFYSRLLENVIKGFYIVMNVFSILILAVLIISTIGFAIKRTTADDKKTQRKFYNSNVTMINGVLYACAFYCIIFIYTNDTPVSKSLANIMIFYYAISFVSTIAARLALIIMYRCSIMESSMRRVPMTSENKDILRDYHALLDVARMETASGSKERKQVEKEITKYYYHMLYN